jgi:hypothetical protein
MAPGELLVRWPHCPAFDIEEGAISFLKQLLLGWREFLNQHMDTAGCAVHEADQDPCLLKILEISLNHSTHRFRVIAVKLGGWLQLARLGSARRTSFGSTAVRSAAAHDENYGAYRCEHEPAPDRRPHRRLPS